jgi:hypothetical protein
VCECVSVCELLMNFGLKNELTITLQPIAMTLSTPRRAGAKVFIIKGVDRLRGWKEEIEGGGNGSAREVSELSTAYF